MKKRILQTIESNQLIQDCTPIIIGVSGGSDSVALLHLLSSLYPKIRRIVVFIDHGLRPSEAIIEQKYVHTLSTICSAEFTAVTVDVKGEVSKTKCSVEEAARNLRYQALETICNAHRGQCIAVGHTSDDQAEEILLRLIRGTGSAGLAGMRLRNGRIIRPLLHESKKRLRDYLQERDILFCEDSSNNDNRFLRNKIRNHLLPVLELEYNPSIRRTLLTTASILHAENDFFEAISNANYKKMVQKEGDQISLDLLLFSREHLALQRRILEKICWQMASPPTFKLIAILLELIQSSANAECHLAKGLRALKQKNSLLFLYPVTKQGYRGPTTIEMSYSSLTVPAPGTYRIPELAYELFIARQPVITSSPMLPSILFLDASLISFPLTLRKHTTGESFRPLGAPGTKKVSRFLSDQKIPARERANYPVILVKEKIIAIAGLRIDNAYRLRNKTEECITIQWRKI